jgi:predicted MFS family arabinose efflux permease
MNYNWKCTLQVCFCSPMFCSWFFFMFGIHLFLGVRCINLLINYNWMSTMFLWVLFLVCFCYLALTS